MNPEFPYRRTILLLAAALFAAIAAPAQPDKNKPDIETCFNLLPDSCFSLCDWRGSMAGAGIRTLDVKNGFIAFRRNEEEPDFFQAALFKSKSGQRYVAVNNRECESFACFNPRSYFFLLNGDQWTAADANFFSGINTRLFYTDTSVNRLLDTYPGYFKFDYRLPRKGTLVTVELDVCEYIAIDHPEVTDEQYQQLISGKRTIYLQWDAAAAKFLLLTALPAGKQR